MNVFTVLFLLIAAAGVFSQGSSMSAEVMKLATEIETDFIKMKSIECRHDYLVPDEFKQNCTDFLKDFELVYKNCFCHKDESLDHHWCHCCEDRPVIGDLVFVLYKEGELKRFNEWLIDQSLEVIDEGVGNCEIVHVRDSIWEFGASKVEDVKFDGEEDKLVSFFNCDSELETFASVACGASRAENSSSIVDSLNDDYYHYETVELY